MTRASMSTVARPANCCVRQRGAWTNTSGRVEVRYLGRKTSCDACPSRARCLAPKDNQRSVSRWEHEAVLERHRARMQSEDAGQLMRRRSAIVEHPFGTLKCRAGYQHFLVRGFDKVRGEWSLMALCYNFTRVLNILGFERFVACMSAAILPVRQCTLATVRHGIQLALETKIRSLLAVRRPELATARWP